MESSRHTENATFIDIFAGAGGLSLGLLAAGWQGLFAIEKSPMAFETLRFNLIDTTDKLAFQWPAWLPRRAMSIENLLAGYSEYLAEIKNIPLLAGGPPCQGFSTVGRRDVNDERNRLFERYLDLVAHITPLMLFVENVRGFAAPFRAAGEAIHTSQEEADFNAAEQLERSLQALNYRCFVSLAVMAKDFGVPQLRPRYMLIAVREDVLQDYPLENPFVTLCASRNDFLRTCGLEDIQAVTLRQAISDLEKKQGYVQCVEPEMGLFSQGTYGPLEGRYQALLRRSRDGEPIPAGNVADSHRFSNHRPKTVERFQKIMNMCRPGMTLSEAERQVLGINKRSTRLMAGDEVSHTLTSLPDDFIHYSEPRILTVREFARIQSFPDWYEFKSQYTTGGEHRKDAVPRYTQVANAVPPLLAQAVGRVLLKVYAALITTRELELEGSGS